MAFTQETALKHSLRVGAMQIKKGNAKISLSERMGLCHANRGWLCNSGEDKKTAAIEKSTPLSLCFVLAILNLSTCGLNSAQL